MSANVDAIDGETGLLAALSPKGNADLESLARFGETWRVCETGLNVKKYPTVGASQRIIDALLGLPSPVDLEAIEVVRPRVSEKYARLMHYMDPKTPAHAKFSLSFACAAALRFGKVSLKELDDEALQDPVLRSLIRRVEVDAVDEYDPNYPVPAPYDMVTLVMKDGAIVETQKVRRATGHADRPLSFQQMQDKFLECAAYGGVSPTQAEVLFRRLQQLPQLDNVAAVFLFE
jgi:2-methylcitrate dehydratase PrpD